MPRLGSAAMAFKTLSRVSIGRPGQWARVGAADRSAPANMAPRWAVVYSTAPPAQPCNSFDNPTGLHWKCWPRPGANIAGDSLFRFPLYKGNDLMTRFSKLALTL